MKRRHKRKTHRWNRPPYRRPAHRQRRIVREMAGVCPRCGCEDLTYGNSGIQDESYIYEWTCPQCGSSGMECHDLVFDEHLVDP